MKLPPLQQQVIAKERANGAAIWAHFMEQGTGKSYVTLDEAETFFIQGDIQLLMIIAPNGVHRNWIEREIPKLLSVPYWCLLWTGEHTESYKRKALSFINSTDVHTLRVFAVNIEAFARGKSKAEKFCRYMMKRLRTMCALDESVEIKNNGPRTRHVISIGRLAPIRRILTGKPVTQSPFNFYYQAKFLQDSLLGFSDYTSFKAYYAEWIYTKMPSNKKNAKQGATVQVPKLVRYRNLGILKGLVDKFSYTVTKRECLDLPSKVYVERLVEMTENQSRLYTEALTRLVLQLTKDETMTLAHAFTRLTRLSQICGGFYKADELAEASPIPGGNNKILSLRQYVEDIPENKKVIVWARFKPELRAIAEELGPRNCALYWGEVDSEERNANIDRFLESDACRYFVGNPTSGKYGFTLTVASHVLYYSNSYSANARWQSEDRTHRIGQTESVTYTDLTHPRSLDTKIRRALLLHEELANVFAGDKAAMLKWLTSEEDDQYDVSVYGQNVEHLADDPGIRYLPGGPAC
jgi:Mesyanzhinovviridae DNA helicase